MQAVTNLQPPPSRLQHFCALASVLAALTYPYCWAGVHFHGILTCSSTTVDQSTREEINKAKLYVLENALFFGFNTFDDAVC